MCDVDVMLLKNDSNVDKEYTQIQIGLQQLRKKKFYIEKEKSFWSNK